MQLRLRTFYFIIFLIENQSLAKALDSRVVNITFSHVCLITSSGCHGTFNLLLNKMTGNGLLYTRSVKATQVFLDLIRLIRPPGGDILFGKSVG